MALKINTKGQTVHEAQNTKFEPLEAKEYAFSIVDVDKREYSEKSNNAGKEYYAVQLRVRDGQKGANRRIFANVPLHLEWAPTAKNPNGSDAFTFYDFFSAVLGKKSKDFRAEVKELIEAKKDIEIPSPKELLGKPVNAVLKIVFDDYAYDKAVKDGTLGEGEDEESFKKNEVAAWKPAADITEKPETKAFEL